MGGGRRRTGRSEAQEGRNAVININAWVGRERVTLGYCEECGAVDELPMPPADDCEHPDIVRIEGTRVQRVAQVLRLTYGTAHGERRPMHAGRNDWILDAEAVLKAAGVV